MKKLLAILLAICMVLALAACSEGTEDKDENGNTNNNESNTNDGGSTSDDDNDADSGDSEGVFKIGVYNYISGTALNVEQPIAFQLAMEDYGNEVNGEKIEVIVYDTLNDPSEAVTGAQYLIGEGCDAVIGSFQSADVVAAYPLLEEAKIFNIMAGTSGSIVTDDQVYSFRGSFNANMTASTYVDVCKDYGYETVAIFYGQDEASVSNYEIIAPEFEAANIEIVATETGSFQDTDFSSQCMKIVAADPDVVYVVCSGAGVNFVKQLREYGYNGIIMNKDEWMTSHVEVVGEENSNYLLSVVPYTTYKDLDSAKASGASDNVIEFLERYVEVSGGDMPTLGITYRMYDCMKIVLEAATIAGTNHDSDALVEACLSISDLQGCSGTIDFTQGDREPTHSFTPIIYDDGGSKTLDIWEENGGYEAFLEATGRSK